VARAIWSGAIGFGLVSIPVKMYGALAPKEVRFHQLARSTGARINLRRVDSSTGEEVPYTQIVKGYEVAPDSYVEVDQQELDALAPERTRAIEIEDFVKLDQIDPVYYDRPYYLAPAPGAAKPYRLLREAMAHSGRVAIGRVVIRSREQLVALRATDEVLMLSTMAFADEVRPAAALEELADAKAAKPSKRELEIAEQLIDSLARDFEPERYRDDYREAVLAMITRKAEGKQVLSAPERKAEPSGVPDLMGALKASLDAARESGAKPRTRSAKKAPAAKKTPAKPRSRKTPAKSKR
jgi:DNA end-binding protein Ku